MSRARVTELRVKLPSRARVTELRVKLPSRARLSETSLVVNDQSKGDLERSSRDQARQSFASRPQDFQWSTTITEQGSCLLTIPVLAEGDPFGLAKQYLPGQVTFKKLTLRQTPMVGILETALLLAYGNMRPSGGRAFEFYLQQLTKAGQTTRERTKPIGVRPSSGSGL